MKANYTRVKSGSKKSWNTTAFSKGGKQGWQKGQPSIPKTNPEPPHSGSKPEKKDKDE